LISDEPEGLFTKVKNVVQSGIVLGAKGLYILL